MNHQHSTSPQRHIVALHTVSDSFGPSMYLKMFCVITMTKGGGLGEIKIYSNNLNAFGTFLISTCHIGRTNH